MNRIDPGAAGAGAWRDRDPALGRQRHPAPPPRSNEELGALADQLVKEFELKWRMGARTSAFIVKTIKEVASKIEVSCGDWTADGKSIMAWLCLGVDLDHEELVFVDDREVNRGAKAGTRFKVVIRGPDAVAAMGALTELFSVGDRVDRCVQPGCPSPPLLLRYKREGNRFVINYGCTAGDSWQVEQMIGP